MPETSFTVPASASGTRIDLVVAEQLDESRSASAARLARGEVSVDGTPVVKSHRVSAGERVVVAAPPTPATGGAGVAMPPVRFEDDHLLVVAKPAGLVVHPGAGHAAGTLVQVLADAGFPLASAGGTLRPGIVHRLDRETSGLLVVAKTDAAYHALVAQLQAREVHRRYLALVEAAPPADRGRVEAPIGRDPRDRTRFAAVADGKPATTHWELLATGVVPIADDRSWPVSLLSCRLETGRTHQIRVHLRYAGIPVAGDRLYGARRDVAAALGLDRFFLHAAELGFRHPVSGAEIRVDEPLPADLAAAAARAELTPDAHGRM
jgi:23S rRNA pseudouridine1911/1915/1917 synthase